MIVIQQILTSMPGTSVEVGIQAGNELRNKIIVIALVGDSSII